MQFIRIIKHYANIFCINNIFLCINMQYEKIRISKSFLRQLSILPEIFTIIEKFRSMIYTPENTAECGK